MNATSEVLGAEILELELLGFGGTYYFLTDLSASGVGSPAWSAARVRASALSSDGVGQPVFATSAKKISALNVSSVGIAGFGTSTKKNTVLSASGLGALSAISASVRGADFLAAGAAGYATQGATTGERLAFLSGLASATAADHLAFMGDGATAGDMLASFSGLTVTPAIGHLNSRFNWFAQHFQVADLVANGESTTALFSEALKYAVLSGNSTSATNLIAGAFAGGELLAPGSSEFVLQRSEIQATVINAVSEAITDLKAIGLVDYIDMAEGLIRYAEMRGMDRGARDPDMALCVNPEMIRPAEQREMVAP